MIMTGLKAGYISESMGNCGHRLVISRYAADSLRLHLFDLYSLDLWENGFRPSYEEIIKGFNLNKDLCLGSASVNITEHELYISTDRWKRYECLPQIFLEFFKNTLLEQYKQKFPDLVRIKIDMPNRSIYNTKVTFLEEMVKHNE